jgi:cellobiose-specific phosphotransferase system component IIA
MVDNEAVYKVLFDGLMNAIDDIETKNYTKARMTLIKAQAVAMDIILQAGDTDNPILQALLR